METLDTLGRRIIDLAPPDEVREQRLMAEQRTAQILEPYFHALNDDELTVFGGSSRQLRAPLKCKHSFMPRCRMSYAQNT